MNLFVTLPWPPANVNTNSQWRISGNRIHQRPEATAYKDLVATLVRQELITESESVSQRPLAISFWQYPPDNRRRDVDGLIKVLLDAVAVGLGIDDRQFRLLSARIEDSSHEPRIEVLIKEKE